MVDHIVFTTQWRVFVFYNIKTMRTGRNYFFYTMLTDDVKLEEKEENVQVLDIAELIAQSMN